MIESVVLGSVVKVIDRFTDLLKYRRLKRQEFFKTVIEPLFDDLMLMHTDYIKMFDDCRAQLLDNTVPLREIAEALRQRRVVYESLRIKARAISEGLEQAEMDEEVKNFLRAAAYHLPDGELGPVPSTYASLVLSRIYSVAGGLTDARQKPGDSPGGDRKEVLNLVISTSEHIRTRWAWICEEYVRVKLWSLQ